MSFQMYICLTWCSFARPSQFACAQRQRLQDASAEHVYISGLSSSLRGRRKKNGVGDNGFSRSVREVYFPSFALVDVTRAWNCCLIWHLVELGAPALMRSLPCWWRVCSDVSEQGSVHARCAHTHTHSLRNKGSSF